MGGVQYLGKMYSSSPATQSPRTPPPSQSIAGWKERRAHEGSRMPWREAQSIESHEAEEEEGNSAVVETPTVGREERAEEDSEEREDRPEAVEAGDEREERPTPGQCEELEVAEEVAEREGKGERGEREEGCGGEGEAEEECSAEARVRGSGLRACRAAEPPALPPSALHT